MHNPESVAQQFAEKLASRSRHVVFLLGAGASCAAGLPDTIGLGKAVSDGLDADDKAKFDPLIANRDLEQVLTRLRALASVLADGDETLDGFTADAARTLDRAICAKIASIISSAEADLEAHRRFGLWLGRGSYERPVEVFTTNYDLLIESGLEDQGVPYFDGFAGTYRAKFRPDLVDQTDLETPSEVPRKWVRVWKLHGSVSWSQADEDTAQVVRSGDAGSANPEGALAIYPSLEKYRESRRIPFVVLGDRLRRALATPETLCITSGYAFADDHINQVLFDAARYNPSSEIICLSYSKTPEIVQAQAKEIPNFTAYSPSDAICGGKEGEWGDCDDIPNVVAKNRLLLGDFAHLARFLVTTAGHQVAPDDSSGGSSDDA